MKRPVTNEIPSGEGPGPFLWLPDSHIAAVQAWLHYLQVYREIYVIDITHGCLPDDIWCLNSALSMYGCYRCGRFHFCTGTDRHTYLDNRLVLSTHDHSQWDEEFSILKHGYDPGGIFCVVVEDGGDDGHDAHCVFSNRVVGKAQSIATRAELSETGMASEFDRTTARIGYLMHKEALGYGNKNEETTDGGEGTSNMASTTSSHSSHVCNSSFEAAPLVSAGKQVLLTYTGARIQASANLRKQASQRLRKMHANKSTQGSKEKEEFKMASALPSWLQSEATTLSSQMLGITTKHEASRNRSRAHKSTNSRHAPSHTRYQSRRSQWAQRSKLAARKQAEASSITNVSRKGYRASHKTQTALVVPTSKGEASGTHAYTEAARYWSGTSVPLQFDPTALLVSPEEMNLVQRKPKPMSVYQVTDSPLLFDPVTYWNDTFQGLASLEDTYRCMRFGSASHPTTLSSSVPTPSSTQLPPYHKRSQFKDIDDKAAVLRAIASGKQSHKKEDGDTAAQQSPAVYRPYRKRRLHGPQLKNPSNQWGVSGLARVTPVVHRILQTLHAIELTWLASNTQSPPAALFPIERLEKELEPYYAHMCWTIVRATAIMYEEARRQSADIGSFLALSHFVAALMCVSLHHDRYVTDTFGFPKLIWHGDWRLQEAARRGYFQPIARVRTASASSATKNHSRRKTKPRCLPATTNPSVRPLENSMSFQRRGDKIFTVRHLRTWRRDKQRGRGARALLATGDSTPTSIKISVLGVEAAVYDNTDLSNWVKNMDRLLSYNHNRWEWLRYRISRTQHTEVTQPTEDAERPPAPRISAS